MLDRTTDFQSCIERLNRPVQGARRERRPPPGSIKTFLLEAGQLYQDMDHVMSTIEEQASFYCLLSHASIMEMTREERDVLNQELSKWVVSIDRRLDVTIQLWYITVYRGQIKKEDYSAYLRGKATGIPEEEKLPTLTDWTRGILHCLQHRFVLLNLLLKRIGSIRTEREYQLGRYRR